MRFDYDGYLRTVEPHTYGQHRKGERMLCAYQVSGGSHTARSGWRMFREKDMSALHVSEERFHGPREGYQRGDGFFTSIIAQL